MSCKDHAQKTKEVISLNGVSDVPSFSETEKQISAEMKKITDEIITELIAEEKKENADPAYRSQKEHERAAKRGIRIDWLPEDDQKFQGIQEEYPVNSLVKIKVPHEATKAQTHYHWIMPKDADKTGKVQKYRIVVPDDMGSVLDLNTQPYILVGISFGYPFVEASGDVWEGSDDDDDSGTLIFYYPVEMVEVIEKAKTHPELCYTNGKPLADAELLYQKECCSEKGQKFTGVLMYAEMPELEVMNPNVAERLYPEMETQQIVSLLWRLENNCPEIPYETVRSERFGRYDHRDYFYLPTNFEDLDNDFLHNWREEAKPYLVSCQPQA